MKVIEGSVEVSVGSRKFSRPFTKTVYENREDILNAASTDKDLVTLIEHANYSIDLTERARVRQAILNNEAATAASEEKSIKDLMKVRAAAGKPVTEDQARKIIEVMKSMEV
jgi:hypothetical protein